MTLQKLFEIAARRKIREMGSWFVTGEFIETMDECWPEIQAVLEATAQLTRHLQLSYKGVEFSPTGMLAQRSEDTLLALETKLHTLSSGEG